MSDTPKLPRTCPGCGAPFGYGCPRDDERPRVGCYFLGGPPARRGFSDPAFEQGGVSEYDRIHHPLPSRTDPHAHQAPPPFPQALGDLIIRLAEMPLPPGLADLCIRRRVTIPDALTLGWSACLVALKHEYTHLYVTTPTEDAP